MTQFTELRVKTAKGYVIIEERPPNSYTWTPATWHFTDCDERPVPMIVCLNPDGSVWADWDAVRKYCARVSLSDSGGWDALTGTLAALLAVHEGRASDTAWSEVRTVNADESVGSQTAREPT